MHRCGVAYITYDPTISSNTAHVCVLALNHLGPHYAFIGGQRRYWTDSYEKS
jgi:hypothetical protein